ncbi:ubinuclein-1-like isoform X1 [Populus alba x Populus x berolinensis]|uniref:Ubinuclein-1-like isoform X1 n=1 Tax=Populus alba x Populus x berolinensis TaxID=444605 RepID=A0AAD6W3J5_9ROSI|nr:ubinuclein-1-like isoform X1 [Populus alba x Populus x berolinensis]
MISEQYENVKFQSQSNSPGNSSKRKSAETKMKLDPSLSVRGSNGDAYASLAETKDIEKSKTGGLQPKNLTSKPNDAGGLSDSSNQKSHEKSSYVQPKLQTAKTVNNAEDLESSVRSKEKNGVRELPDLNLNISDGKIYTQAAKTSHVHRKDGSSVRPKSSILEKAIRELEKMVAESRPPAMENHETDTSAQAIKRRLPTEIKLKLAKVARLAASQGKMSKELLNRLMSILGHLIQLRTLKRNLKIMINTGLSVKQEKDDRFQQIKKEVAEIITTRIPSVESNALVQQAGASDDFQEIGSEEKGALKKKFSMDVVLEDKICDLYDLFVEGLDEDSGPQVRKLYVELAQLWPSGLMDNHGIKRAICRAKERRRVVYCRNKDLEKMKNKKMLTLKQEEGVRAESGLVAQPHVQERVAMEMAGPVLALASKPVSNSAAASVRLPSPSANGLVVDKLKEKPKGSSSNSMDESKMGVDGAQTKKKLIVASSDTRLSEQTVI